MAGVCLWQDVLLKAVREPWW